MRSDPKYLEKKLGYTFKQIELLQKAITHRSFAGSNNERFEFLGDALLGVIIAEDLFARFPKATEGQLTRLRASLVKKESLYDIADYLELNKYILLGEGELRSGGLQRQSILSDCVEAVIAAIYLDSDFISCKKIILKLYESKLNNLSLDSSDKDPKTILQELLQAKHIHLPEYTIIAESGLAHNKSFSVRCTINDLNIITEAQAKNRREAEQQAALLAFQIIKEQKNVK